ncbi:MAG: T9SS type A sorting domain-containing protein [Bacteroidia bacterium]
MRKSLLLSFMLPVAAFAQNLVNGNGETATMSGTTYGEQSIKSPVNVVENEKPRGPVTSKAEWLYDAVQIGETQYDLQVNGALANRIQLYGDGSVSAVFTMASDASPFLTRGTGYAHFDGSNWSDMPLSRLEDDRAGWCNVGVVEKNGTQVEFVVSHHATSDANAQSGGLYLIMNDGIGSDNWSIVEKLEVGQNGPFWPRAVGSGSYIHIWTAANTSIQTPYEGIRRPNTYYRYDVDASDWLDEKVLMDGYNDSTIAFGWSDAYQMDVDGDNIAIVSGGSGQNLFLFKSNDNGENWTTTVVDEFGIQGFDGNQSTEGDTLETNSGSVSVILDESGNAHVWWNYNRILDDTEGDSSWSFFPATNGLVYWNEVSQTPRIIAQSLDINGNGQLDLFQDQWATNPGARYSNNTLACFPDAGIDADGNIYCVYSAPNEDALSPEGPVYRDVYVLYSEDDGATWSTPQPIVEGYETEDVFCHIARDVDDNLHLMWQRDDYAGTSVINGHVGTLSKIMYAAVPKSSVLNDEFVINRTSIDENNSTFNISKAYPNPTTGNAFVNVELEKENKVRLQITNLVGQEVYAENLGALSGNNRIDLNTQNLSNGVYIYNITVGESTLSGRVIVE